MEETVKQGAVLKEEVPELAVDGEDTVPVDAADELRASCCSCSRGIGAGHSRKKGWSSHAICRSCGGWHVLRDGWPWSPGRDRLPCAWHKVHSSGSS